MKKHKGGRHTVRNVEKRKRKKREVISYEEMPLEDYGDERTQISKEAVKRIVIGAAVLVVLGLVLFAAANSDSLTPEKIGNWFKYELFGSHDTGFPARLVGTSVNNGNFQCDGDISYVSDTSFVSLNSSGNEIGYNQHKFSKPVLKTAGDNVLIYNLGGNGYVTGTKTGIGEVAELENYIITADVNARGYAAFVTEADGYRSRLHVYNIDREKIYTYSFANYYVNSVALNDSGSGCVVCGVTGDKGSLLSVAYALDFDSEEPKATYSLEENTIYDIEYLSSSTVCMIGSSASYTLNIGSSRLTPIEYSRMELTAYDIDPDTDSFVLSLSRSGDGRKCSLEYINRDGEIVGLNDTELSISSVSLFKNRIAALDSDECVLFDNQGNELGTAEAGIGAKSVRLCEADAVYVLGINEIRFTKDFV